MNRKFKKEFSKIIVYGLIAMGIGLVFFAGYYINAVESDFHSECSYCTTTECMDYDSVCGDFGLYWYKLLSLTAMMIVGIVAFIIPNIKGVN